MIRPTLRFFSAVLLSLTSFLVAAGEGRVQQDARAIEIVQSMQAYRNGLPAFQIIGSSSSDARLPGGMMVANTEELLVSVLRPGSMHFRRFDGEDIRELYVHEGQLSVYSKVANSYAQAKVPRSMDEALEVALDEYDIDLPLMDLLGGEGFDSLVDEDDSVIYLGDKRRVRGTNCYQVAIRLPELDVQLWIEEGDKPLPRKIMLTSKWAGGSPRLVVEMDWNTTPKLAPAEFEFKAPKDADRIQFINAPAE